MKNLSNYLNKYFLILLLFAIITHFQWFNPFSILNSSDWIFWPNEATNQLYNSYGAWVNFFNFGSVNVQTPFNFFTSIWSLFTNLGFSYDLATKVTFLTPIAILGFISPYILFKKLTKNGLISFIVALFYGTTTYFLIRQTTHIPVAFVYAIAPLIFYLFIGALEKNKLADWLIFVLFYWISICYEIRITYIITFVLLLYFLIFSIQNIKNYWKNILFSALFVLSLNLFWLLPTILGGFSENILAIANRGLFGNFLFDLGHAFVLYDSSWTGSLSDSQFIKQPIIWYFWFIPIIAFSGFLFNTNNKYKKKIIFFGIVSLIGIFLTKQAAEPLSGAYLWLYNNFLGFNLFREASKFYLLTAIGYAGLLGYSLLILKKHKNKILNKYIFTTFIIIIISIAIWNVKPLVTGKIRTMFIPRHIPNDYLVLKDYILEQPEFFRTFWMPNYSRWSIYTNQKPEISNAAVLGTEWKIFTFFNPYNNWLDNERLMEIFKIEGADELFDSSAIKYVIVPVRDFANDDDFYIYCGGKENPNIRDWYISGLDKVEWLEKIDIGTKELVVYENKNYKPHLYQTLERDSIYKNIPFKESDFQYKNPTEYKIAIKNINQSLYLNFSESFNSNWKLRIGDFSWYKVLTNKNYFLTDDYHFKNEAELNSFYLDPEFIKKNFPGQYKENSDGSIDLEMVLYFRPQSYFYLGVIISGAALLGCLGYLTYYLIRQRKKRKNEKNI